MTHLRCLVWLGVIGLSAVTTGCRAPSRDPSLTRVRDAGVIRIGYAVEAPFAFVDGGRVTGESPEVARRVVEVMAIPDIAWVQTTFDRLIPGLHEGRFDVIAAGMFITEARKASLALSHPTLLVRQALLVRTGNPLGLHGYDDIVAKPSTRVAVVALSFEAVLLERAGVAHDRLVQVPDSLTGRVAVESGLVDTLALSSVTIGWLVRRDALGRIEMATPFRQPTRGHQDGVSAGAFGFRLADIDLREAWNAALATFVGTETHGRLIAPFGFTPDELPPTVAGHP